MSWLTSFPEPQTREDDAPGLAASASEGLAYRCMDCAWTGRGGVKALAHHSEDHHAIALRDMPGREVSFACCETADVRRVDAEGCRRCSAAIDEPCAPWCRDIDDIPERDDDGQ